MLKTINFHYISQIKLVLKFACSTLFMLSMVACDTQKVQRKEHSAAVATADQSDDKLILANRSTDDLIKLDANKIGMDIQNPEIRKSLTSLKSLAKEISSYVLNQNILDSVIHRTSKKLQTLLGYLNDTLLLIATLPGVNADKEVGEIFNFYVVTLEFGCDENLSGCRNIKYFKSDFRSANVLVANLRLKGRDANILAEAKDCNETCQAEIRSYYKDLSLAFDLKNSVRDQELEFLYLNRARDYAKLFLINSDSSGKNASFFSRHGRVFENIINQFPAEPKNPRFRKFVESFQPWYYTRLKANSFPYGSRRLFAYAAQNYLYDETNKNELSAGFRQAMKDILNTEDKGGPSLNKIIQSIQTSEGMKNVVAGLKLNVDFLKDENYFDEYFYIVDRLFKGHIDLAEAGEIWQGSKQDVDKLAEKVETYLKVQMLSNIHRTYEFMTATYNEKDITSKTLVENALQKSKIVSDTWGQFHENVETRLSSFLGQELRNSAKATQVKDKIDKTLQSLRNNVKYLSAYPNMFVLMNYAMDLDANHTINSWFGPVDIKVTQLVPSLFSGNLNPWFRFGNDDIPLSSDGVLVAYYYSIALGTFDSFKLNADNKTLQPLSKASFLRKLIKKLLNEHNTEIKSLHENLNKYYTNRTNQRAMTICESLKKNLSTDITIAASSYPKLKLGVHKYVLFGDSETDSSMEGSDAVEKNLLEGFKFLGGTDSTGRFRAILFDENFYERMRFMENLLMVLRQDLVTKKASAEQIAEVDKIKSEYIDSVQTRFDQIYAGYIKKIRSERECLRDLDKRERERRVVLFKNEISFLKGLYKELKDNVFSKNGTAFTDALNSLKNVRSMGNSPGKDDLSSQQLTLNYFQFLKRIEEAQKDLSPKINLQYPENLDLSGIYDWKLKINLLDSSGQLISESDFLRSYAKGFEDVFSVVWFSPDITQKVFENDRIIRLSALINMYRYGKLRNFKGADNQITESEIFDELQNALTYAAFSGEDEVFIYQLLGKTERVSSTFYEKFNLLVNTDKTNIGPIEYILNALKDVDSSRKLGMKYRSDFRSRGYFLFSPDNMVESMPYETYSQIISRSEDMVRDILAFADKLEDDSNQKFKYHLSLSVQSIFGSDGIYELPKEGSKFKYIRTSQAIERQNQSDVFHLNTANFFKDGIERERKFRNDNAIVINPFNFDKEMVQTTDQGTGAEF